MHGYSLLRPQLNKDYFHELYDAAEEFGIEIEGHHTETGPGVFETVSIVYYASRSRALMMMDVRRLWRILRRCGWRTMRCCSSI